MWQIKSTSSKDTLAFAKEMGSRLRGGEAIELISDLGGGKTTFTRGLAEGMGSKDLVHSPSFTISNEYRSGDLTMHHFDFYRLLEPGIMQQEISEVLEDPSNIVVVEWAEIIKGTLPSDRITVHIAALGDDEREITVRAPRQKGYLHSQGDQG